MLKIVIASNNKHKVEEIREILKNSKVKIISLDETGFRGEIEETGETLAENAFIKAEAVRKKVKDAIIIADDTGLMVDYLAGAPGVYSARFAGEHCSFSDNNRKLIKLMKGVPRRQRGAVFKTAVAVIFRDGTKTLAQGCVKGEITARLTGKNGFGYDPVFYVSKTKKTLAEMDLRLKNKVSHRQIAVKKAWKLIKQKLKLK